MKKIITIFLVISLSVIFSSAAFAQESNEPVSLNKAVSMALDYDKSDLITDIDIRLKIVEAEDAVKNAKYPDREQEIYDQYKDLSIPAKEIWKEIVPLEKQYEVDKLEAQKLDTNEQLVNKVKNTYFTAIFNRTKAELSAESKALAAKDLENMKVRKKLGQISDTEMKQAELSYKKAELDYASALDERDYSLNEIADLLGISADNCSLGSEKIVQTELPEYSKYAFIELLKKYNNAYLNALKDQEFKQKRNNVYTEITRYGVGKEESQAQKDLLNANINLRKVLKDEITQMYTEYIDLKNMEGDIKVAQEDLKVEETLVKQMEVKYSKGLVTELDLKKEQLSYKQKELALNQQINDFNLKTGNLMIKLK